MKPAISFIVLFYRDAPTVESVIRPLEEFLKDHSTDYEIIAIDDHSPDDTWQEIERVAANSPQVIPIRNETNLGVGASFRRAVEATQFEWIGYTDGDDQYEVSDLSHYFPLLSEHDVITGNRSLRAEGWHRRLISYHFNSLIRTAFNLPLKDTNSALKLYRGDQLRQLPVWSPDAFYDAEILVRLKYDYGARIVEVPIKHRRRPCGSAGGISTRNILSILQEMFTKRMSIYLVDGWTRSILKIYCFGLALVVALIARLKGDSRKLPS